MGRVKEWYQDFQETFQDRRLANVLGIEYEELLKLDYEFEEDKSNEDLIYKYRIVFKESCPEEILKKINRLNEDNVVEIEPWEIDYEIDYEEQFNSVLSKKNFLGIYKSEVDNLISLSQINVVGDDLKQVLNRQIFIGIITSMETFLSDVIVNLIFSNEEFLRNFVKSYPDFQKRKFVLGDIFSEYENLKITVKKVLFETIYHNLPVVREMYQSSLKIQFPEIGIVHKYVNKRHDLVHRSGKSKEGESFEVNLTIINDLRKAVDELIFGIVKEIEKLDFKDFPLE